MAVTFLPQQRLYRAYKKIEGMEHQEYFHNEADALARQQTLDKKAEATAHWKLHNLFIQSEGVKEGCINGDNIGIRHVYLRINKTRKKGGVYYPSIQVSAFRKGPVRTRVKNFPLSTYGWPEAVYEAVRYSYSILYPGEATQQDLDDAIRWVARNEEELAVKLWGMFKDYPDPVYINSEITRSGQLMHINLRPTKYGGLALRAMLPHTSRNTTVKDYRMLVETAAYYVALQLIHREFKNEDHYEAYAMGIYLLLKGDWMTQVSKLGIDCHIEDYDVTEWRRLINQWCVDEYGHELITP